MIALVLGFVLAISQQNVEELPNSCIRFFNSTGLNDQDLNGKNGRTIKLPKDALLKGIAQRACAKSFPWPSHTTGPAGTDYHGELATSRQMRQVRDSLISYKQGKRDAKNETHVELQHEEASFFRSPDITQHILFADLVLLKKLRAEGQLISAAEEAQRILKRENFKSKLTQWTDLDDATYLSIQNLTNLLLVEAASLRMYLPIKSPAEELQFLVSFLDSRPGLKDTFGRLGTSDPTSLLLHRVMDESWYSLKDPPWVRSENLAKLPFVQGASQSGGEFLVILKGRRLYSITSDDTGDHLLTGRAAASAYTRVLQADVDSGSSRDMRLFSVSKFGKDYQINIGSSLPLELSVKELATLKGGTTLPTEHPLTKSIAQEVKNGVPLVLYTNPLLLRDREQSDSADDVAFAIQKSYRDAQIVRDPLSERTSAQVRDLHGLKFASTASLLAVVAPDSFEVKDYKLIQNLEAELRTKGVEVVEFSKGQIQWTKVEGRVILVITGHIDSALATFVRALGAADVFKDNYVIFNSCRAELSRALATEMATHFGAAAVYSYDSLIRPEEVEPLVLSLPEIPPNSSFTDGWRKLVKKSGLNGIWTVCRNSSGDDSLERLG